MALNFPDSPTLNQVYIDATSGFSYQWDGTVWQSFSSSTLGQIQVLDDISGSFNGSTQTFALTSSGAAVIPANAQQIRVVLGGVVQDPADDYTVSGSNITFTTPPTGGLSFSGVVFGTAVPINTITDGSVTEGSLRISTKAVVGAATTFTEDLVVNGNARVVGVLTVGTSSIILDGNDSTVTASAFYGDGSNLTGAGIGSDTSVNTTGIITASAFYGDGSGLSGISVSATPEIIIFSPADESTGNSVGTDVVLTFNQGMKKGSGNIELRNSSGIGTIIESIDVTSTSVSTSGGEVTIGISTILPTNTDVYVVIPSGVFLTADATNYAGISTYNFTTSDDAVTTYSPANNATNVSFETSIVLTFPFPALRGTGTIEIRKGTVDGTIHQTYDATTSDRISVSGNQWILDPVYLPTGETVFLIIPDTGITNYDGLNIGGTTKSYSFTVENISQLSFDPAVSATEVPVNSNITLTFNTVPVRGTGTIELRQDSATGTIIESFDAATSDRISVVGNDWILNPTRDLSGINVFLIVPASAIGGFEGLTIGGGTTSYGFTFKDQYTFAWGYNIYGQLGQNNQTAYSSPVQIPGTTWNSISAGSQHSLATKTDGTLWAWGDNGEGHLGQNNTTEQQTPIQIPGTTWSSVSGGGNHSLATKTDGTLWAWGRNAEGQLGQNNQTEYSSPVQIPGTTWSSVSGGNLQSLATKTDGTLWAWGYNIYGQLGQNNRTEYSSPIQIPGNIWSSISAGSQHSLATKTDGTLWSWGRNTVGQLGQNNTTDYSSPVQIPGTTWSSISAGSQHSLATKTDGTLWAWSDNGEGHLGQNNTTQYSSPVQIPGTTWNSISAGSQHSLATKTDGTLWAWGDNGEGHLGQNNTTDYSSPIQIPGTTWSSVSGGQYHTLALQTSS